MMTVTKRYEDAREIFRKAGVDTDAAIETLKRVPVSMHCWQGDDVTGFDQKGPLTGESRPPETIRAERAHRRS